MIPARLAGAWRLISFESRLPDGSTTRPFGDAPVGMVVFAESGHVSAQLMPSGWAEAGASADPRQYVAYYGPCEVDEAAGTLNTRVEGSLFAPWIGGDQPRSFRLEGDRLVLSPPGRQTESGVVTSELVWQRVPPSGT